MNINDSNIRPVLTFRRLVYLHMQQLTNFPYIEKDFDALTDYELLCLVVKYLNDVIANSNEQNTSITNLYNAFLELQTYMNNSVQELEDAWNNKTTELENAWNDKTTELETAFNNLQTWINNYFDNLDVQDEINNKLDKMLEDGVLEQIIEQFLQSTALWCFDTVASMKQATNLINGSYAKTLGFYAKNDGGMATYKIRTKTNDDVIDERFLLSLNDNTLLAELIIENPLKVEQVGAKGDGVTDDTLAIQSAIDNTTYPICFGKKTYLVSTIRVSNRKTIINGNNATLKSIASNTSTNLLELYNDGVIYSIINDLVLDGNKENNNTIINGLYVYRSTASDTQAKINNVQANNFTGYGIYVTGDAGRSSIREIKFDKVMSNGNKAGFYADSMTDSYIMNSTFANNSDYGIYLDTAGSIKIVNTKCYFNGKGINSELDSSRIPEGGSSDTYKNHGNGIYLNDCTGISITTCEIQDNAGDGIYCNSGRLFNFFNVSCDSNGLMWDNDLNIITYDSQNMQQYFYGIYFNQTYFIELTGYFNNFRYNQSGYIQKASFYLNGDNSSINITSRLQVTPFEYKDTISLKNTNVIINGETIKFAIPLSIITLNEGYTLVNNNWNSSYIYLKNNVLYFKLCIRNENYIPNTLTGIGNLSNYRPLLMYISNCITSNVNEDMFDSTGAVSIDKNGLIRAKSDSATTRIINIQGSYTL